MEQIVEAIEEQPGAEPIAFAYQLAGVGLPAPDSDASVILRPDRDDPRCRVPAPEPLVLIAANGRSLGDRLHKVRVASCTALSCDRCSQSGTTAVTNWAIIGPLRGRSRSDVGD